ncbi:tRNA pseudouridine(55) synthase TruB [bacterium]|nr:tRNA pseudouridine(55) synthase TruB [bacterium]
MANCGSIIVPIYKEKGCTSHDVIEEIRKITKEKRVGHAGTLDPLAEGVLVVGIGRKSTKKLSEIVKKEKEYIATIKLGWRSNTDDEEGKKEKIKVSQKPSKEDILKILSSFEGFIYQRPPDFSAIKVSGVPAYKLARQGKKVILPKRKVYIKKIELIDYHWPYLKIKVVCGKGVYIRSLARDIGEKLATGGYLFDLERVRVGEFEKKDALTIKEFRDRWEKNIFCSQCLFPLER